MSTLTLVCAAAFGTVIGLVVGRASERGETRFWKKRADYWLERAVQRDGRHDGWHPIYYATHGEGPARFSTLADLMGAPPSTGGGR